MPEQIWDAIGNVIVISSTGVWLMLLVKFLLKEETEEASSGFFKKLLGWIRQKFNRSKNE